MPYTQRETARSYHSADLDLGKLVSILWRRKSIVAATTFLFLAGALIYAFTATEWYRAEALLAPVELRSDSGVGGELSGLLALAGGNLTSTNSTEAMAVLESREMARNFIQDLGLLQIFFEKDWDPDAETWRTKDSSTWPDVRDAVDLFHQDILTVSKDRETSLVSVTISWTDPDVAAAWTNDLVRRVNSKMRSRALDEAGLNISFLTDKLAVTNVVALQQSISKLLESEMQKLMLAQGNTEFSFRVIDPAEPPKYRSRPNRPMIVVVGTLLGILLGVFVVLVVHAGKALRQTTDSGKN